MKKQFLLLFLTGLMIMMQPFYSQCYSLGLLEKVWFDEDRIFDDQSRKLEVTIWYPTYDKFPKEKIKNNTWKIKDVIKNASFSVGAQFPLIIFSHGYSGGQWQNSWIIEHLVLHGYIVAAIKHYGNSYPNMIPEICVRPWNRPADMSFVLNNILQDQQLSQHIDKDRVGALGFSQGGM